METVVESLVNRIFWLSGAESDLVRLIVRYSVDSATVSVTKTTVRQSSALVEDRVTSKDTLK